MAFFTQSTIKARLKCYLNRFSNERPGKQSLVFLSLYVLVLKVTTQGVESFCVLFGCIVNTTIFVVFFGNFFFYLEKFSSGSVRVNFDGTLQLSVKIQIGCFSSKGKNGHKSIKKKMACKSVYFFRTW